MRYTLLITFLLTLFLSCPASEGEANHEQMHRELLDFKISYLSQEMKLTDEQQTKFESLYRQMEQERHALFQDMRQRAQAMKKKDKPTDAEFVSMADDLASLKQREGAIELTYYNKFKQFLSPAQLYTLKRSEAKFNRKVMEMRGKGTKKTKK